MELKQNDFEHIRDLCSRGLITTEQANVEMVRARRVLLVTCSMSSDVRRALNAAVKRGELGRLKKDGHKPEAYFHPTFEYLVPGERNEHETRVQSSLSGVLAHRVFVETDDQS